MLGKLGKYRFEVTDKMIKTFDQLSLRREKNYAQHFILNYGPILEFLGERQQETQLEIMLSTSRGVNVEKEYLELESMFMKKDTSFALCIGNKFLGFYFITKINFNILRVDNVGNILAAKVSLALSREM